MQGVEIAHCNAAIEAILAAYYAFFDATVEEALRPISRYGKKDTLGMDAMPEITIIERLHQYDKYAVVITEETGSAAKHLHSADDPRRFRTVYISDPTDRSAQMKELLEGVTDQSTTVREVLLNPKTREQWESRFGAPASITGGSSAITCVRRGVAIFSVMVNYVTQQMFVSCSAGNYVADLPSAQTEMTLDTVRSAGRHLYFRNSRSCQQNDMRRFVTFMGKSGYSENLRDSKLMSGPEVEQNLFYSLPGGPLRVLYLSTLQPENKHIGFVLSNGEKVGEWIHWIPFISFARTENDENQAALRMFEVFQDRPWTKDGVLMATPPAYSIFKPVNESNEMVINVGRFSDFVNPSRIRATLIATRPDNTWATRVVNQYGYRAIVMHSE